MPALDVTQKLAEALNAKFADWTIRAMPGTKFDRISIEMPTNRRTRSAHAFVERSTGKLYRGLNWRTPAPGAKCVLTVNNLDFIVEGADVLGEYLYEA